MLRPVGLARTRRARAVSFLLGLFASLPASANPEGVQVMAGTATLAMPNAQTLEITNSPGAILNWQGFDIGAGEVTRFIQQDAASAVLNRVVTQNPSEIMGQLVSNGRVFLINPSGILIGRDGMVDTAGLVMSTLDINNEDFLAGRYVFEGGAGSGAITNHGYIKTAPNGEIILIAPKILNAPQDAPVTEADAEAEPRSGIIETEGGDLILAAGYKVTISSLDDPDITFEVQAPDNEVVNLGQLLAKGGTASVLAGTIQHSGEINADTLSVDAQGRIRLVASARLETGDDSVTSARGGEGLGGGEILIEAPEVAVSGTVDVSGDTTAGTVHVLGDDVTLTRAVITANSTRGDGGNIRVGGEFQGGEGLRAAQTTQVDTGSRLEANAGTNGDGGTVIVWSDDVTDFKGLAAARGGSESGDGGLIEISGKETLRYSGGADVGAPQGDAGTLLLDPRTIFIVPGGATVSVDNPNPFAGDQFGSSFTVLANGNILVLNQNADVNGVTDSGSVALLNTFGSLLGVVNGTATNQRLGSNGFFNLGGNIILLDPNAPNGGALQAGALIVFDDDTGTVLGTALGGSAGELFGNNIVAFSGTNMLVAASSADIGGIGADVGVVRLINGLNGAEIGRIQGQSAGEFFGSSTQNLFNGNFRVISTGADVGGLANAGTVVTGSLTTGTEIGRVSGQSASEFFGNTTTDLGSTLLVRSAFADVGGLVDAGAVVMISNVTGLELGRVQGAAAGDEFGSRVDFSGVPFGTYLIRSEVADTGGLTNNGVAILVNRNTGIEIGRAEGLASLDQFGLSAPVADGGNYWISAPVSDFGGFTDAGSMVLVSGTTGQRIGTVNGGSAFENFGLNGISLFTATQAIVTSRLADTAGGIDSGSVVAIDRATGLLTGRIDGTSNNEFLGQNGIISRSNGNYFIPSPLFDTGGGVVDAGSMILADGATGNLLGRFDGNAAGEQFGSTRFDFGLANEHIVVVSTGHNGGAGLVAQLAITDLGGGNILEGSVGGLVAGDLTGASVVFRPFGNYLVRAPNMDVAGTLNAGSVFVVEDTTGGTLLRIDGNQANEQLGSSIQTNIFDLLGGSLLDTFAILSPGHGVNSEGAVFFVNSEAGVLTRQIDGGTSETLGSRQLELVPGGNIAIRSPFASPISSQEGTITFVDAFNNFVTTGSVSGISVGEQLGGANTTFDLATLGGVTFLINTPDRDVSGNTDAGAVLLMDGVSGSVTLLGAVSGQEAGDRLGQDNIIQVLNNGDFVIFNPDADDPTGPIGGTDNEGAIILVDRALNQEKGGDGNGRTYGQAANEAFGSEFVVFESFSGNGNYFAASPDASPGGTANAGSLYLIDGSTGLRLGQADGNAPGENFGDFIDLTTISFGTGFASTDILVRSPAGNSGGGTIVQVADVDLGTGNIVRGRLDGTASGEGLGNFGVSFTSDGVHYFARSPFADPGGNADAGSVYFVNALTGVMTNRVDGSSANEQFGTFGNTEISAFGSNLFVTSELFDNGAALDAGRVMLLSTSGALVGELLGNASNEFLGSSTQTVGADRWVFGTGHNAGAGGIFAIANQDLGGGNIVRASLLGGTAGDALGSLGANFVSATQAFIRVPLADVGGLVDAGTAIFVNSSLQEIGRTNGASANEQFSNVFFTTLSNGNFLFRSPNADRNGLTDTGSAMFVSGTTGTLLAELAGTSANERFTNNGFLTLTTGDLLFLSPLADPGGLVDAGALVHVNVDTGAEIQRVVGLSANENLGSAGSQALSGGRRAFGSPLADVNGVVDAGRIVIFDPTGANEGADAENLLFTTNPSGDFVLTTGAIQAALAKGANLILQAHSDIIIQKDAILSATGGSLTLQAGRSIIVNGLLNMPETNLTLIANESAGAGVDPNLRGAGAGEFVLVDPQVVGKTIDLKAEAVRLFGGDDSPDAVNIEQTSSELFERFLQTGELPGPAAFVFGIERLSVEADFIELVGGSSPGAFAALVSGGEFTVDAGSILLEPGTGEGAHALFVGLGGLGEFSFDECTGCGDTLLFTDPFLDGEPTSGIFIAGLLQEPSINAILALLDRASDSGAEGGEDDDDEDEEKEAKECAI